MPKTTQEPVIKRSFYKKERKKKRPVLKFGRVLGITLFCVFLTAVLVGLAAFWAVKDDLSQSFLSDLSRRVTWQLRRRAQTSPDMIVFDGKADNAYAPFRDGLAVLTVNRLVCYDATGKEVFSAERDFKNPCLQTSSRTLMAYNRGGGTFVLADDRAPILDIETERPIITAKLNRQGYAALVTQGEGYKSVVWVYNSKGKLIYKYSSPDYYVIDVALSPDSSLLAVSCAGYGDNWVSGQIKLFSLAEETPKAVIGADGLVYEVYMPGSDKISGIFENSISFWDANGVLLGQALFSGRELLDYSFTDSGIAARSTRGVYGPGSTLSMYDYGGSLLGAVSLNEEVICQSGGGGYVTLVTSGSIIVYDGRLRLQSEEPNSTHVRQILQRDNGTMFLIYGDYAQLYSP